MLFEIAVVILLFFMPFILRGAFLLGYNAKDGRPIQSIAFPKFKKESKESKKTRKILDNIDRYDGTANGQEKI